MRTGISLFVLSAVGVIAALALGDALRPNTHSSVPATTTPTRADASTVVIVSPNTAPPNVEFPRRFCGSMRVAPEGEFPLLLVEVLKGTVSCEQARRVMKAHYIGGDKGSWSCHGPEGDAGCGKGATERIRAYFDSVRTPAQNAERIALRWARSFARQGCAHMTQPGCEHITCERVGGFTIPDCTPVDVAYRESFENARVEEIASKGRRVAARFSNGELIRLVGATGGEWMVHKVGWKAGSKVFE